MTLPDTDAARREWLIREVERMTGVPMTDEIRALLLERIRQHEDAVEDEIRRRFWRGTADSDPARG